jgi:hypothetical protein
MVLAGIALIGLSFIAGWLVADNRRPARGLTDADARMVQQLSDERHEARSDLDFLVKQLRRIADPLPRPGQLHGLEPWEYPKSRKGHLSCLGGHRHGSKNLDVAFELGYRLELTTNDDFDKVVAFYGNRSVQVTRDAGFPKAGKGPGAPLEFPVEMRDAGMRRSRGTGDFEDARFSTIFVDYDCTRQSNGEGAQRPVLSALVGMRLNTYYFNAFITRAKGEPDTHILLTLEHWSITPKWPTQ